MDLKSVQAEIAQLQLKGSALIAKSAGSLTDREVEEIEGMNARLHQLRAQEAGLKNADVTARIGASAAFDDTITFGESKSGHLVTSAAAVKSALRAGGQKALVAEGSSVVPLDLSNEVVLKGRDTPVGVVNFLTTTTRRSSVYRYLREKTVTNNADFVETGEAKPESAYEVESVDGVLKFLAHVSAPVDQTTLDDAANLEAYLVQAMTRGIYEKLGGAAVAAMQSATGAQAVAAGSEPLASIAAGQLAVNTLGYQAGLVILNRADYQAMVTARNESGAFDLGLGGALATGATAPADTIFGVPVLVSPAATLGQAIVLDPSAVGISVDNQGVRVAWDQSGELFDKNQRRARVELKAAIDVAKPAGIALVDLAA